MEFLMDDSKIKPILEYAISLDSSDVHLVADSPPLFRIHGELLRMDLPVLSPQEIESMVDIMVSEVQKKALMETRELDCSFSCIEDYQFRVNVNFSRGHMAVTIRCTPTDINKILRFELPPVMKKLAQKRRGLVVISGTAGSGKSTTLTYMVDLINRERKCKVITIEDPIEYTHKQQNSLIMQREVGTDTLAFANALKYCLRQDPDVVVIGEVRDFESISMALTTAETGHLVITTVHAPDVIETLNRIIDVYPIGFREQISTQLAGNLLGVINQVLVPKKKSEGRLLATELLTTTISIRNLIRRGAFNELRGQMDSEEDESVHTLENCLSDLVRKEKITKETALDYAKYPNLLTFPDEDGVIPKMANAGLRDGWDNRDTKILIIDDDKICLDKVATALRDKEFRNIMGFTGKSEQVLEMVDDYDPEIIILDTAFHDLDCFELCRKIRKLEGNTPYIVMITNQLQLNDIKESKSAGANDFVIKTEKYDLLINMLEKYLNPDR